MEAKIILVLFLFTSASANKTAPQVHEQSNGETVRQPRQSLSPSRPHVSNYQPPVFNFNAATQQNKLRMRYVMQQQADFENLLRRFSDATSARSTPDGQEANRKMSKDIKQPIPHIWNIAIPSVIHKESDYRDSDPEIQDSAELERVVNQIDLLRNVAVVRKEAGNNNKTVWQKVPTIPVLEEKDKTDSPVHSIDRRAVASNETEYTESDNKNSTDGNETKSIEERNNSIDLSEEKSISKQDVGPFDNVTQNSSNVDRNDNISSGKKERIGKQDHEGPGRKGDGINSNEGKRTTRENHEISHTSSHYKSLQDRTVNIESSEGKRITRQNHEASDNLGQLIYVPPSALSLEAVTTISPVQTPVESPKSGSTLDALNALIGQSPDDQLRGLQRILNKPGNNIRWPIIQGPRPFQMISKARGQANNTAIREGTFKSRQDEAAAETSQVPTATLHYQNADIAKEFAAIQAQLDVSAKAQAADVLAKAQQDAMVHVAAQHRAIAAMQQKAEQEALAQIQKQNGNFVEQLPVKQNLIAVDPNVQETGQPLVTFINFPAENNLVHIPQPQAQHFKAHDLIFPQQQELPLKTTALFVPHQQILPVKNEAFVAQTAQQHLPNLLQIIGQNKVTPIPQFLSPVKSDIIQITPNDAIKRRPHVSSTVRSVLKNPSFNPKLIQKPKQLIVPYTSHHNQALALIHAQRAVLEQAKTETEQRIGVKARNNVFGIIKEQSPIKIQNTVSPVSEYSIQQNHPPSDKPRDTKLSFLKSHSVKQGHHTPNAYQEVVMRTHHQLEKYVPTGFKQKKREEPEPDLEHSYAARYAFGYKIKDFHQGNEFGHEETREGKSTTGKYHVLLPDGRMQKVEYYADPTGYHAKVTYEDVVKQQ